MLLTLNDCVLCKPGAWSLTSWKEFDIECKQKQKIYSARLQEGKGAQERAVEPWIFIFILVGALSLF